VKTIYLVHSDCFQVACSPGLLLHRNSGAVPGENAALKFIGAGLTPVILATWEIEIRRIVVQGLPRQIVVRPHLQKITRARWTGGVAQAIEHLLCKCKALISNRSPIQKNKIHWSILFTFLCSLWGNNVFSNLLTTYLHFFAHYEETMCFPICWLHFFFFWWRSPALYQLGSNLLHDTYK
jgi:hypothetical protein